MTTGKKLIPDYIFEASWEVCNKVGGIHTVLSTRAHTLQSLFKDRVFFIGPDVGQTKSNSDFIESESLLKAWRLQLPEKQGLSVRVGRWNVPGKPVVILVNFKSALEHVDGIYTRMWENYGVDSLHGYDDYHGASAFGYAVGQVIEDFFLFYSFERNRVVAHFHEWMLGMGALYLQCAISEIATIFTTHATSIGRSIAGNNKPLYGSFEYYDGDQMARELNMESKHSVEKQTAIHADCFTTVSEITARECEQLLGKKPDVITPNGFESHFVPSGRAYQIKKEKARKRLRTVAHQLTGEYSDPEALMVAIGGRYEYKNKGIDVFIEAIDRIRRSHPEKHVLAFILVPAWIKGPRKDLQSRLATNRKHKTPLESPYFTHELMNPEQDNVSQYLQSIGFTNQEHDRVKLIFVPSYLTGDDGIFNLSYYDLLIGMDLTVFPSYYEPWGYTPLESIAFGIPTITTNLAGFGLWAKDKRRAEVLSKGVEVIERTEDNYFEVAEKIKDVVISYSQLEKRQQKKIRAAAKSLSAKASWSRFIKYYLEAYHVALKGELKRRKMIINNTIEE